MNDKALWRIEVLIEATDEDASQAHEAIVRALCPDEDHAGYCPIPWTTSAVRLTDLDEEERAEWQAFFEEQRQAARDAGESGA